MTWGLEPGRVYNRRRDIHGRFGGQQQGGIVTPANYPLVIVVTGESGLQHGYADRWRADGVFEYFGEGQVSDMKMTAGNRAVLRHSTDGEDLLLFSKAPGGLRFEGDMVYEAHHIGRAPDREGNERDAIVFELRKLEAVNEAVVDIAMPPAGTSLSELFARALAAATVDGTPGRKTSGTVYERSRDVRVYVLARAKGACEGCGAPAPFMRKDGSPYLEPHHIRRVSDGGPDHPEFVIALGPTCHRRVHAGADGEAYNTALLGKMPAIQSKVLV